MAEKFDPTRPSLQVDPTRGHLWAKVRGHVYAPVDPMPTLLSKCARSFFIRLRISVCVQLRNRFRIRANPVEDDSDLLESPRLPRTRGGNDDKERL